MECEGKVIGWMQNFEGRGLFGLIMKKYRLDYDDENLLHINYIIVRKDGHRQVEENHHLLIRPPHLNSQFDKWHYWNKWTRDVNNDFHLEDWYWTICN